MKSFINILLLTILLIVGLGVTTTVYCQTLNDLEKNRRMKSSELDHLHHLKQADNLYPLYSYTDSVTKFTIKPDSEKDPVLLGCAGDFNDDNVTDFALVTRDITKEKDQLTAYITGVDSAYVLASFEYFQPLTALQDRIRRGYRVSPPECYRKSTTGVFNIQIGLEPVVEMNGDMVTYGWYSYLWSGDGFKKIITSD